MAQLTKAVPAGGRERILDAAERLFASEGYHGASLREITRAAGVELGLCSYHFRSKDELYRQVLLRRAPEMAGDLDAALAAVSPALTAAEGVGAVLRAYVTVHMDKIHSRDAGWRSYIRLAARAALLLQSVQVTDAAAMVYDPILEHYKNGLSGLLGAVDPDDLDRRFYIFQMALLGIALDVSDAKLRPNGTIQSDDQLAETLVDIFTAAFLALAGNNRPGGPAKK